MKTTSGFQMLLAGIASLAVAIGVGRFAFTPLVPMMQADGLLDVPQAGWLAAAHFFGYFIGALGVHRIALSAERLLMSSLWLVVLGSIAMGIVPGYYAWLVCRFLVGAASAWTLVLASNYLLPRVVALGEKRWANQIYAGVGAGITGVALAVLLLQWLGISSAACWIWIGLGALLGVLFVRRCVLRQDHHSLSHGASASNRDLPEKQVAPIAERRLLLGAYAVLGIGYIVPATFLPVMALEVVGAGSLAAWAWPVFGISAFISTIAVQSLIDKFGFRKIWALSHFIMFAGLAVVAILPSLLAIVFCALCVGGTFMIATMCGLQEIRRVVPSSEALRYVGGMTALFAAGQMLGPMIAALGYAYQGSFTGTLALVAVLFLLSAFALLKTSPTQAAR